MRKLGIQFALGGGLAVGLLWFVQRQLMAGVEGGWGAVGDALQALPFTVVVGYALAFLGVHVARMARWVLQVRPLGERDTWKVVSVCAVGSAAIVVFPFRLGELVRPYLLDRVSERVSFGAALGTAVVERILDGLFITMLFFVTIATAPVAPPELIRSAGWLSLGVFGSATVGLALFAWQRTLALQLLRVTFGLVDSVVARLRGRPVGLVRILVELMESFLSGVRSLRSDGTLWSFAGLTVVYWGINAFGIWLLATGFGLALPWYAGIGLLSVLVVGIMVPSAPGLVGTFQAALAAGLLLYLPESSLGASALAFALVMNVIQLVIQIGAAVPFLPRVGIGLSDLVRVQQDAAREAARA